MDSKEIETQKYKRMNHSIAYEIYIMERHIQKLRDQVETNNEAISELCDHTYERVCEYGERTQYVCTKCNS